MDLDKPLLGAAQVAELAETDLVNIHTWTTRGFTDPYHTRRGRRGGGRIRSYTIRDALKFVLMARLHHRYRTPLPQGQRICEAVFGHEFNPERAGYLVVEEHHADFGGVLWFADLPALEQHLAVTAVSFVVNVQHIVRQVESRVGQILAAPQPLR